MSTVFPNLIRRRRTRFEGFVPERRLRSEPGSSLNQVREFLDLGRVDASEFLGDPVEELSRVERCADHGCSLWSAISVRFEGDEARKYLERSTTSSLSR